MIELSALTSAIAALIHGQTGIFAVDERLQTTVYPSVYVDVKETQTSIIAGGRQVQRQLAVRLFCNASRDRQSDETRELVFAVYAALLPYFSACGRRFAPLGMATGGEAGGEVSFTLEFCDVAPANLVRNSELMDRLDISLSERTDI